MDDRGVSPAVGFVTTLGITLLLVVSLFTSMGGLVDGERDRAVESELTVIGHELAGQLSSADSLVRAAETPDTVRVSDELPERISSGHYSITIEEQTPYPLGDDESYRYKLIVKSSSVAVSAVVDLKTGTQIEETTLDGGPVVVRYDAGSDRLEVTQ